MAEHFGSEFGLDKFEVVDIIKGYDWCGSKIYADQFGTTQEKIRYALINKYVNLPMSIEFLELRRVYRIESKEESNEPQYLAELKKLLFPEDYAEQPVKDQSVDKTKDPLYIGLVAALYNGTKYTKEEICNLLGLTDTEYWIMRQDPRVAH